MRQRARQSKGERERAQERPQETTRGTRERTRTHKRAHHIIAVVLTVRTEDGVGVGASSVDEVVPRAAV